MKKMGWIIAVVVLFVAYGCATTETGTGVKIGTGTTSVSIPLPSDINIVPPNPSVGNVAKCSGVWTGVWASGTVNALTTIIIVEKITPEEVIAVYAQETVRKIKGGSVRVTGKVSNDSIVLKWSKPSERTITLTPIDEKTIIAEMRSFGIVIRATLKKTTLPK